MKTIRIKCTGSELIDFRKLEDFQGGLKNRDENDISLIIKSIEKYGFSFPFFVWKSGKKKYCLDGHGRIEALKTMFADGWTIPDVPVVYIHAKDKAEAKNKLLRLNSQYGRMTAQTVFDFVGEIEIDWADLELPSGMLDISLPNFEPTTEEEQGRLDKKDPIICPECGYEF